MSRITIQITKAIKPCIRGKVCMHVHDLDALRFVVPGRHICDDAEARHARGQALQMAHDAIDKGYKGEVALSVTGSPIHVLGPDGRWQPAP